MFSLNTNNFYPYPVFFLYYITLLKLRLSLDFNSMIKENWNAFFIFIMLFTLITKFTT